MFIDHFYISRGAFIPSISRVFFSTILVASTNASLALRVSISFSGSTGQSR